MFVNTFAVSEPDIRLRDPEVRRRNRVPKDLRHETTLRQSKTTGRATRTEVQSLTRSLRAGSIGKTSVMDDTWNTIQRSKMNRKQQKAPDMRQDLITETDAMVHQYTRETKAEVLHLMQAESAGVQESKLLLQCYRKIEKAILEPERMLYLADRSNQLRALRALRDEDEVQQLTREERDCAMRQKAILQEQYQRVKATISRLKKNQAALVAHTKERRKALGLSNDIYSGVVLSKAYPLPRNWDPKVVRDLAKTYTESQNLREESAQVMTGCSQVLKECRSATEQAIKEGLIRTKEIEREASLARAKTMIARNQAARNKHKLEIAAMKHRGPLSTKDLTTAERPDRPLVRTYNLAKEHRDKSVTVLETSSHSANVFEDTIRQTADDIDALDLQASKLDALIKDTKQTRNTDISVRNVRERYGPHRRV